MSAEASGWVWRRSPYKGVAFAIHLAIADSVNDQNDYELWMRQAVIATKARTRRATVNETLAKLIADGYLELVAEGTGGANRYRFLMPPTAPVVYDSRPKRQPAAANAPEQLPLGGVRSADTGCTPSEQGGVRPANRGVRPANTELKQTQGGTQGEPKPRGDAGASLSLELVRRVWDRCSPKPATPFIGAVKIAERLLAAGWSAEAVENAMVAAPTISTGAVELVLNRQPKQQRRGAAAPVASRRDGPQGRVQP